MSQVGAGFYLLARAAAGNDPAAEREATAWILRGLRSYFRARGSVPLDRCLGLPSIKSARRAFLVTSRDFWLCVAHGLCDGGTDWARSVSLADEMERFVTCIWPSWCDFHAPPRGSSQLREALFHAMKAACAMPTARGLPAMPSTARMLHGIAKNRRDAISLPRFEDGISTQPENEMTTTATREEELAVDILAAWRSDAAIRAEFGTLDAYAKHREAQALKPADEVAP